MEMIVENKKLYMNVERLYNELLEMLTEERDGWIDDSNRDFLMCEMSDEILDDYCEGLAYRLNDQMGEYLNSKDRRIPGNFCNIDYDYSDHVNSNYSAVKDMTARLNAGEESEQADADRDYLVDWFWEAFGTFGIKYYFNEYITDILYEFEHKTEKEYDLQFKTTF